jgi:DNA repair exonuclease SbcCD ATPase subunit
MRWLNDLVDKLLSPTQAAQERVDSLDQRLADLRAKVRALPLEQRAAYEKEIQQLLKEQARARNNLDDALDDRYDRQDH